MNQREILHFFAGSIIGIIIVAVAWLTFSQLRPPGSPSVQQAEYIDNTVLDRQIVESRQNAITRAVKEVSPAVVGINVIKMRYRSYDPFYNDPFFRGLFPPRVWQEKVENLGSGFIISPDGYVLTNEHVVHEATQVIVTVSGDKKYDATIVGFDYDSDIALLKIADTNLPYIRFGNSDEVIIGEWSIAIGNPFGLFSIHAEPTVTVGVVSAHDRDFDRNEEGRLYQDMIQTDAAINRGNSGGPLVNSAGELIGMNTMIFTERGGGSIGLGFAIPANRLRQTVETLKDRGQIDRDFWIGLDIQNVDRIVALGLKLPEVRGVVVTGVEKGSPADKAGLEVPDVIYGIEGLRVDNVQSAQAILRNSDLRVGDTIKLNVFREGKQREVRMKLEKKG